MKLGYIELPKDHPTKVGVQPAELTKTFRPFIGYFSYGKCEPERTALRIAIMQQQEKFPHWMGMSLQRLLQSNEEDSWLRTAFGKLRLVNYMGSYPKTIPPMTPFEKAEPGGGCRFTYSGLLYLQDAGAVEIRQFAGHDFVIPTASFVSDLERGLKFADEIEARDLQRQAA